MTIDYLAAIASFAFRNVPNSDTDGVLRLMDRESIDRALVSSLEAVMYRNVQAANELLAERIRGHRERLLGAAVVNPVYPQAAADARVCLTQLDMRAIRLYPGCHGYELDAVRATPAFRELMGLAAECAAPVSIAFMIEDPRQQHVIVHPVPVNAAAVAHTIRAFPEVNFVLERLAVGTFRTVLSEARDTSNWSVETSGRFLAVRPPGSEDYPHRGLPDLIEELGPDRVLLGTDLPLQYPRAALIKLEALDLPAEWREKIMGGNAARLLGLG